MQEKDWLSLVAVRSDSWLLAIAFHFGAGFGFDRADRKRLFNMINELPTIFEVVTGTTKKQLQVKSSGSNHGGNKSKSNSRARGSESLGKYAIKRREEELDGVDEHGETLCGACGENYGTDEFWICCKICEKWFHGKCVKITPARAEHIKQYKYLAVTRGLVPDLKSKAPPSLTSIGAFHYSELISTFLRCS